MPNKENNNIDDVINSTFDNIKNIVDANTIIGKTIKLSDNIFVIPVSKINVGIISGGGIMPKGNGENMGTSTGFSISPVGFVAVSDTIVNFIPVNNVDTMTKNLVDNLFKLTEKIIEKSEVDNEE